MSNHTDRDDQYRIMDRRRDDATAEMQADAIASLSSKIDALLLIVAELKTGIEQQKVAIQEQKASTSELVAAWATAKGINTIVKYLAAVALPIIGVYIAWKKS